MASSPVFSNIPLTLVTSDNVSLPVYCLSVSLIGDVETRNIRACPKDFTLHRWFGGRVYFSGLVQANATTGALPDNISYITLSSGQKLYECRLISAGTGVSGISSRGFISVSMGYSFLTYSSASSAGLAGTDGTHLTSTTAHTAEDSSSLLPSAGSRGYIKIGSSRIAGLHLKRCTIEYEYKKYAKPSFPTVLPVYDGSSMTVSGMSTRPSMLMHIGEYGSITHVLPSSSSGNILEEGISNAILYKQSASVVSNGQINLIDVEYGFKGSLKNAGAGSNQGEWYY